MNGDTVGNCSKRLDIDLGDPLWLGRIPNGKHVNGCGLRIYDEQPLCFRIVGNDFRASCVKNPAGVRSDTLQANASLISRRRTGPRQEDYQRREQDCE